MWERLRSIWTIPDLRNKILFTLGMLLVFRLVAHVPVPGIDPTSLQTALGKTPQYNQLFGLLDVFSGGSLQTFSVAALGVYPYITASIVMQLVVPIFPRLEALQREGGEAGRTRISQYTRVLTVRAHKFSASARAKIEGAGGTVEEIASPVPGRTKRAKKPAAQA